MDFVHASCISHTICIEPVCQLSQPLATVCFSVCVQTVNWQFECLCMCFIVYYCSASITDCVCDFASWISPCFYFVVLILNFGAILHCVHKFNFISDMQLVIYVVPVIMSSYCQHSCCCCGVYTQLVCCYTALLLPRLGNKWRSSQCVKSAPQAIAFRRTKKQYKYE